MKKKEDPKKKETKKGCEENTSKACYTLKKHPSATSVKYEPRVCPDPDRYKKKCPSPIEICKDTSVVDECAVKKKRQTALTINDDIVVIERKKPPKCPTKENPCINDNKAKEVKPEVKEYTCDPKDAEKNSPCGEQDEQ